MDQKAINQLMQSSPEYRQRALCENCERLEKRIKVLTEADKNIDELEAERDEYKRQADGYYQEAATAYETRNKAIELLSEQYTDLNRDGKTILDFQNTWIRQTRDENDKLRAERDRLIENISTLLAQRKEAQHKSIAAMTEVAELRARRVALVKVAELKRNVIIRASANNKIQIVTNLVGNWIAIPEEDFNKLKDALVEVK